MIYCFIGFGNHAKNRILPVLRDLKVVDIYVFSETYKNNSEGLLLLNSRKELKDLTILHNDVRFIVTRPAGFRLEILEYLSSLNCSIFLEKPLSNIEEFDELKTITKASKAKFIAGYMYKYSSQYEVFNNFIESNSGRNSLQVNFEIPNYSRNTYRNLNTDTNNLVYDISCYASPLLLDLKIPIENLEFNFSKKNNRQCIQIFSKNQELINVKFTFCLGGKYKNVLTSKFSDNFVRIEPFFWGRRDKPKIESSDSISYEHDSYFPGFETMLSLKKAKHEKEHQYFINLLQLENRLFKHLIQNIGVEKVEFI